MDNPKLKQALELLEQARNLVKEVNNSDAASDKSYQAATQIMTAAMSIKQASRANVMKLSAQDKGQWRYE